MSDDLKARIEQAETLDVIWPGEVIDALDARDTEITRLREALEDAIRSPKGVVPDSVALIRQGGNNEG